MPPTRGIRLLRDQRGERRRRHAQDRGAVLDRTEHLPQGDFTPNKDIISGQGIRIKKQSGIDLLAAPFHLKVTSTKELSRTNLENNKGVIVTVLYVL